MEDYDKKSSCPENLGVQEIYRLKCFAWFIMRGSQSVHLFSSTDMSLKRQRQLLDGCKLSVTSLRDLTNTSKVQGSSKINDNYRML